MAVKPRKIPQRQCVGCRTMKDKKELLRVVRTPAGEIVCDLTGKKNGRGTYLCADVQCLSKAIKAKRFEAAFGMQVPSEVYERLKEELEAVNG